MRSAAISLSISHFFIASASVTPRCGFPPVTMMGDSGTLGDRGSGFQSLHQFRCHTAVVVQAQAEHHDCRPHAIGRRREVDRLRRRLVDDFDSPIHRIGKRGDRARRRAECSARASASSVALA